MLDTGGYIGLIVVGLVITFGVGALLFRTGGPFLEDVFQKKDVARSANLVLTVLFHLLTLGVLALISISDIPEGTGVLQTVVFKIGVVLLVVGIAYGVSMLVLLRTRLRRQQEAKSAEISQKLAEQRQGTSPGRVRRSVPKDQPGTADAPSNN